MVVCEAVPVAVVVPVFPSIVHIPALKEYRGTNTVYRFLYYGLFCEHGLDLREVNKHL